MLDVEVCGVKFKNPFVIASGPPTRNAEYLRRSFESGAGGAVARTLVADELDGPALRQAPRPRSAIVGKKGYPHSFTYYSSEFFACEYAPAEWMKELRQAKKYAEENDARLIGSFAAISPESWRDLARAHEEAGCDMLEASMFSCPNLFGLASADSLSVAFDQWVDMIGSVVHSVGIPVFVKIGSEFGMDAVLGGARAAKAGGAAGLTIGDRMSGLEVDINTGRPLLAGGFSACDGPWMRLIVQRFVARVAMETGLPIAFTGGILSWEDAAKAIMVGSTTVQISTAVMCSKKGYDVVPDLIRGLERYLTRQGHAGVTDLRGVTLRQIRGFGDLERTTKGQLHVEVIRDLCDGCGYCGNWCFFDAIDFGDDRIAVVAAEKCDGCGLCLALCPRNAFEMVGDAPVYMGLES